MTTLGFKRISHKTGVSGELVNISESFSLFDASYGAFSGGSVEYTKVI